MAPKEARKTVRWMEESDAAQPTFTNEGTVGLQSGETNINNQYNYFQSKAPETQTPASKLLENYRKEDLKEDLSWHFIGRDAELGQIERMLIPPKESNTSTCCVVWGMTGVGKTQIALQYTQTAKDRNIVLWIPSSSREELVETLQSIHYTVFGSNDTSQKFQHLKSLLNSSKNGLKWLLVFDNVRTTETTPIISAFRPSSNHNGQILITTRTRAIASGFSPNIIEIHSLPLEVAIDLCHCYSGCCHKENHRPGLLDEGDQTRCYRCNEVNQAETRSMVREIVEGLGCHPLAIAAAGKKAGENGVSWVYENQSLVFHWPRSQKHLYSQKKVKETSLKGAFASTFQELNPKGPKCTNDDIAERARTLLEIMSVLDPKIIHVDMFSYRSMNLSSSQEKQISSSKFREFVNWTLSYVRKESITEPSPLPLSHILGSAEYLDAAISKLEQLALISRRQADGGPPSVKTHEIIQLFVRNEIIRPSPRPESLRMSKLLRDHCHRIQDAANIVCNAFNRAKDPIDPKSWKNYEIYMSHVNSLYNYTELFAKKTQLLRPREQMIQNARQDLIIAAGEKATLYHWSRGQYVKAVSWQDLTYRTRKELFSETDHKTTVSLERLGWMQVWSGKYQIAQKGFEEALNLLKSAPSLQLTHILITLNRLAWVLLKRGRYKEARIHMRNWEDEAKQALRRPLRWRSRSYREDDREVKRCNNWNSQDGKKNVDEDKVPEFEVEVRDHNGEGKSKMDSGDSEDEEAYYMEQPGLDNDDHDNDGKDNHISTSHNSETYGGIQEGNLMEYALTGRGEVLASSYIFEGAYNKAQKKLSQVLREQKRLLGDEHPETRATFDRLSLVRCRLGEYDEARQELELELERRTQVLGKEHPETLTTEDNLALVYRRQRKYKKAERLSAAVLKSRETVLGPSHPATLRSFHSMASVFRYQQRFKEAKELGDQVYKARKRLLGLEHPNTLYSINNLASICRSIKEYDEAERLNREALRGRLKILGANHPDTLTGQQSLGRTLFEVGKYEEATAALEIALEGRKLIFGLKHGDTLDSHNHLMLACQHLSDGQNKYKGLLKSPGTPEAQLISGTKLKAKATERVIRFRRSLSKKTHIELSITTSDRLTAQLGDAYFAQGKWEKAEETLQKVVKGSGERVSIDPNSERIKLELIASLIRLQKFARAEEVSGLIYEEM